MYRTQSQIDRENREYWNQLVGGEVVQTMKEWRILGKIKNGYYEKGIDEHLDAAQIRFCLGLDPFFEDVIPNVLKQVKTLSEVKAGLEIKNLGVVILGGGKERGQAMKCELDYLHWVGELRKLSPVVINHGTHVVAYAA